MKSRITAAGIHLALSLLILSVPLFFIVVVWYPGPYFVSDGGLQAAVLLAGVHMVAGPVLTFVVFSPNKSSGKIKFDFVVIGLLQLSALTAGTLVIHDQRPAAAVFSGKAFVPVSNQLVRQQGASLDDLRPFGGHIPLVFSKPPQDRDAFAGMMLLALNKGIDIAQQVGTFQPLDENMEQVAANQVDVGSLLNESPVFAGELGAFLEERNARREDFVYIPFNGRYRRILFVLDHAGRLIGSLSEAFPP